LKGILMRVTKAKSFPVELFGYVILSLGAFGTVNYRVLQSAYSRPQDMGIELGNGSILLLGLATIAVARCLRALERRLDALEGKQDAAPPP
jgi:hypothetical protein